MDGFGPVHINAGPRRLVHRLVIEYTSRDGGVIRETMPGRWLKKAKARAVMVREAGHPDTRLYRTATWEGGSFWI